MSVNTDYSVGRGPLRHCIALYCTAFPLVVIVFLFLARGWATLHTHLTLSMEVEHWKN